MRYILFLISVTSFLALKAQLKETSLGVSFNRGFIFAHSKDVQNTDGSYPWGFQIEWNKQLLDERTWNTCNCYPRTGFILQYVNYDNAVLGQSLHASTYIEPYWGYGKKVSASLKGITGLAYLTNPYQIDKNPTNQSYSLPISGYVALGLGIHVKLNTQLNVNVYGQYNHISNGGIKDPNKGVNWPTLSVGVDYVFKPVSPPQRAVKPFMKNEAKRKLEIIPYWSSRTVVAGEKSRWNIFGFATQYTKQIARINALSIGSELWFDHSLQERLRRDTTNDKSSWRSGMLLGHTFLMGKISFSQQIGIYTYNPTGYFPLLYQRYGMLYQFNKTWSGGLNVLVHGHVANFLDFRLAYMLPVF